jgi:hypothetical protein
MVKNVAFRLSNEAKHWFAELRRNRAGFDMDFDAYYFCLLAGIISNRKADVPTTESTELVDHFPGRYRSRGKLLIALFLARQLASAGVAMEEKSAVHSVVSELVDPSTASNLSSTGQAEFNRFAFGGLGVLREWFLDRPERSHVFIRRFMEKLDEAIASSGGAWLTDSSPPP